MNVPAIIVGTGTGFLFSSCGWQLNLLSLHQGVKHGRRAAFITGIGALTADVILNAVCYSGASVFLKQPGALNVLKWVGIITLSAIAVGLLRINPSTTLKPLEIEKGNYHKSYGLGFLLVITNPGLYVGYMGWVSLLLGYFPSFKQSHIFFIYLLGFFLGGVAWFAISSRFLVQKFRRLDAKIMKIIFRVFAALLLLVVVSLILRKF